MTFDKTNVFRKLLNMRLRLALFVIIFVIILSAASSVSAEEICETNIDANYTRELRATVNGESLTLKISARFGGAIDSLTWNGKEFVNAFDHGRQIQYAWQVNGQGECLNPTEGGSMADARSSTSTSRLLSVCSAAANILSTTSLPAYWTAPDEQGGICPEGIEKGVNTSLVSDSVLHKTVEIGYAGLENVIRMTANIIVPDGAKALSLEIPTGYLTYEFNQYWFFDPSSGELSAAESAGDSFPFSFVSASGLPPILSTPDGEYAMGAYTTEQVTQYSILGYENPDSANSTNKWSIGRVEQPLMPQVYTYESFVIVGTLAQVQDSMRQLYELRPSDLTTPYGYVDLANCLRVAGWAYDAGTSDEPLEIEVYRVNAAGEEELIDHATANSFRSDLVTVLGISGFQGYDLVLPNIFSSGEQAILRVYAVNPDARFGRYLLINGQPSLTCP